MATIEIRNRWNGGVLFEHETDEQNSGIALRAALEAAVAAGADLSCADLRGANLRGANLRGADLGDANLRDANLGDANLRDANLRGADLIGANLSSADLRGAKWADGVTISRTPLQIYGLHWAVTILDLHMQIGCQLHALDAWAAFSDDEIAAMDGRNALRFWRAHKTALLALAASDGRGVEAAQSVEG